MRDRSFIIYPSSELTFLDLSLGDHPDPIKNFLQPCELHIDERFRLDYKNHPIFELMDVTKTENFQWLGEILELSIIFDEFYPMKITIYYGRYFLLIRIDCDTLDFDEILESVIIHEVNLIKIMENFSYIIADGIIYIGPVIKNEIDLEEQTFPNENTFDSEFIDLLDEWYNKLTDWCENAPRINQYITPELWNFSWILQKTGLYTYIINERSILLPRKLYKNYEPNKTLIDILGVSDGIGNRKAGTSENFRYLTYFKNFTMNFYEICTIIEDLLWYRPDLARIYFLNGFNFYYHEASGRVGPFYAGLPIQISAPPIWSYVLLDLVKITGDPQILTYLYPKLERNLKWWENNRYNPEFGLFEINLPVEQIGKELLMQGSPRFYMQYNGSDWKELSFEDKRRLLPVDLNSQMCDYYQNMGILGMMIENDRSPEYFQKAQDLQDHAQAYLWDEETSFYYDFDVETNRPQPIRTIAGFWPLFGGLALKSNINKLIDHLTDPEEFWTEIPIASLAANEPKFSNKIWHGPISISQDLWIITGLKRYNLNRIAGMITSKLFKSLNTHFELYSGIYRFYPARSFNIDSIKDPFGNKYYNPPHSYESSPVHALFYHGLLGAEILDDSINFIPDWSILDRDLSFSVYYRKKKYDSYLSKLKNKFLEIQE